MNGNPKKQGEEKPPERPGVVEETAATAAKRGIKTGLKKAGKWVAKQGAKLAARLGLAEVASDVAATLSLASGPLAPIVTPIVKAITFIATWIAEKVISKVVNFIRKHKEDIAIALLGIGLLLGSPLLLGAGIIIGAGLVGPAALIARVGIIVSVFASALTAMLVPSIGIALIFSLIFTILTTALIVFIINSGAYVVPQSPASFTALITSPYIGLEKIPSPEGPFSNGDLPQTVTYTITITARRGSLTNIQFQYECKVIRTGGGSCPSVSIPDPPDIISSANPFVITYTVTYGSGFSDSVVVDAFTVIADSPEQPGATARTSASIVIGTPPVICPVPGGSVDPLHGSYTPGDESLGHGSNDYWNRMGQPYCRWGLPQGVCYGPSQPSASSNVCSGESGSCTFYGYAADVFGAPNSIVLAPVDPQTGESTSWSCSYGFANGGGSAGYTFICSSGPYRLVLSHINQDAVTGTVTTGQQIGTLFNRGGNTHVHIEFSINGQFQRPEDFFCF